MDTFPPSMEGVNRTSKSFFDDKLWWALGIIIMCAVVWLWMSWLSGGFPFSSGNIVMTPPKTEQQLSEKSILDSLTAPASTSAKPDTDILKNLTVSPSKMNAKTVDTTAVLESLTPKK